MRADPADAKGTAATVIHCSLLKAWETIMKLTTLLVSCALVLTGPFALAHGKRHHHWRGYYWHRHYWHNRYHCHRGWCYR